MDGIHDPNNPARVPPILAQLDQPQEGLPRLIHPIGMLVGRPDPTAASTGVIHTMSDMNQGYITVEQDGTYVDDQGNPVKFKAGTKLHISRAARFPDFAGQVRGGTVAGITDARALGAAPENRAEAPAQTRAAKADKAEGKA